MKLLLVPVTRAKQEAERMRTFRSMTTLQVRKTKEGQRLHIIPSPMPLSPQLSLVF